MGKTKHLIIEGKKFIVKKNAKVIGIITESKETYEFIIKYGK